MLKMETKRLGWNEISLDIPLAWEVEQLDKTYVLLAEDKVPKAEIKWSCLPRGGALDVHLKRFIKKARRKLGIVIVEESSPDYFLPSQKGFEFFFFSWSGDNLNGYGVIIFCRHCRKISLLRFFLDLPPASGGLAPGLIASFSDHPRDRDVDWDIFGMKFSTPREFLLQEFDFRPGAFTLSFSHGRRYLKLFSWGPATFLLSKTDLNGFARQRMPEIQGLAVSGTRQDSPYLQWSFRKGQFKTLEKLPFFRRLNPFVVFRISRDDQQNRILGVMAESVKQYENQLVRESYIGEK